MASARRGADEGDVENDGEQQTGGCNYKTGEVAFSAVYVP